MALRSSILLASSLFIESVVAFGGVEGVARPKATFQTSTVATQSVSDTMSVTTLNGIIGSCDSRSNQIRHSTSTLLEASNNDDVNESAGRSSRKIGLAPLETQASTIEEIAAASERTADDDPEIDDTVAATNTVNARLQAELAAAAEAEKAGGKSKLSKRVREAFRSEKTDEERQRSIEEARDLNGVNPLVAGGSGLLAFGGSYAIWTATTFIAELFAKNPVETDFYTAQRLSVVFRNVIVGLFSLASGFFGVIGLGLVLLAGRVAYGVLTGELDPTPIRRKRGEEIAMPNVWDLMMNKKPGRRGGRKKGRSSSMDDNQFGL